MQHIFTLHVYQHGSKPPIRRLCGTNGAEAQLCQNSPKGSCFYVLFMITEQVTFICILTSMFDTSLNSFDRFSLLKKPDAVWYAAHTCSASGHHQWRLESDEVKQWVNREGLFTVHDKSQRISKRYACSQFNVCV